MTSKARTASSSSSNRIAGLLGSHKSLIFLILITATGIAAGVVLWIHAPYGLGVTHDSLFYLTTAENIAHGEGAFWSNGQGQLKPLTHFPPLYPLTLAFLLKIGLSLDMAARLLGSALFAANIILVGMLVFQFTQQILPGVIGATFIGTSPAFLWLNLQVLSEPIFFLTAFSGLAVLSMYVSRPDRRLLVLAALLAAAGGLSRYAGTSLIVTGVIGLFILVNKRINDRLKVCVSFGLIASGPVLLWAVRNYFRSGSFSNRTPMFHPVNADNLRQLLDVIFNWFWPGIHSHWVEIGLLIVFFGLLTVLAARILRHGEENKRAGAGFVLILLIFIIVYCSAIIVSLTFFDASTRIDDRILSPILMSLVLSSLITMGYSLPTKIQWAAATILVVLLFVEAWPGMLRDSEGKLELMRESGYGFSSRGWRSSEAVEWIRNLDGDPTLATDEAMAVYYLSGVPAIQLPERMDPVKQVERAEYEQELQGILALLKNPNSYLVLFGDEYSPFERPEKFMDHFVLFRQISGVDIYTFDFSAN